MTYRGPIATPFSASVPPLNALVLEEFSAIEGDALADPVGGYALPARWVSWNPEALSNVLQWQDPKRQMALARGPGISGSGHSFVWSGALRDAPLLPTSYAVYGRIGLVGIGSDVDPALTYGIVVGRGASVGVGEFVSAGAAIGHNSAVINTASVQASHWGDATTAIATRTVFGMGTTWAFVRVLVDVLTGVVRLSASDTGDGWFLILEATLAAGAVWWMGFGLSGNPASVVPAAVALDFLRVLPIEGDELIDTQGARLYLPQP